MGNVINIFSLKDSRLSERVSSRELPNKAAAAWEKMKGVFRQHFLARVQASEFEGLSWYQLPENVRHKLADVIRDNPRFGADFGMVPKGGVYSTGESYFEAVQRKTKEGTWL